MFSYISKTNFQIPNSIVDQIKKLDPISFDNSDTLSRKPVYRQLNRLVVSGMPIKQPVIFTDPGEGVSVTVTPELLSKFRERYQTLVKEWHIGYSPFREQELPEELQQQVLDCLPEKLKALNPKVATQSKAPESGVIAPHRDHYRSACLFLLLEGNNEKTVWWTQTEEFEEFDYFRFADVTKIEPAHEEVIGFDSWYVFDNREWHSVHPTGPAGRRTSLCIEFKNISAKELYSLL